MHACFVLMSVCDWASSILVLMFVGTFFRMGSIHTPVYLCYTHNYRASFFTLVRMFLAAFFRIGNIHTLHLPVYLCCWLGCLEVLLCLWVPFLEQGVFTQLLRLFICVWVIISVHGCLTALTVRHKPSWIVAVSTNLATRFGLSQSANFVRVWCTVPEVFFHYPFSQHDFWCDIQTSLL